MPWKLREYFCEDCGKLTRRNRKSTQPHICVDCGKDRQLLGRARPARPVSFTVDTDGEVIST